MDKTILELVSLYTAARDVVTAYDTLRSKVSNSEWDDYCDNPFMDDLLTKLNALEEKINIS
jgi:hypothetical protein